ncbi:Arc family DNA-binding protein [Acinetobacter baumannii]|uniref:Arc family DNA-binding protein n=1 Tax=Acinetobacter baumannii TaxID=470 RepID=UPI0021EFE755|nr:Arc family DNA-binding protein [Acinetobacter baumannii]CAI3122091.1 hypothetical protein MWMV4_MWMV4_03577 [Acinetobacter baumannii]
MSNQADHTIVRLRVPPELKEKIEKAAEENNRSQSAEMVSRLEESFQQNNNATDKFIEDLLKQLKIEYASLEVKYQTHQKSLENLEKTYREHLNMYEKQIQFMNQSYESQINNLLNALADYKK